MFTLAAAGSSALQHCYGETTQLSITVTPSGYWALFFHLARKVIRAEAMPRVEISQAIVSAKNAPAWRGIPRFKKKPSLGGVDPYLSAANKTMMCELFPHANCHLKKMETTLSSFKYHSVCLHRGVCVCTCGCLRACMYHFLALGL